MGAVYLGRDTVLNRQVAVKMIRYDQAGDSVDRGWLEQRFLKEARMIAQLTHPSIIAIHDIGCEGGAAFIVMEYFPSRDLTAWAARGKLTPEILLPVIRSVAEGLDYAHSKGIIHRDIKPANLLLNEAGEAKITDFGIAKSVTEATQTTQGMILGTLEYMAPEQLTGGKIGPPADQYSLAAMAYYLFTGTKVFPCDSVAELSYQILHKVPSPPSQANPAMPRETDRVFARALSKEPQARYPACGDFVEELGRAFRAPTGSLPPPSPASGRKAPFRLIASMAFITCAAIAGVLLWPHSKRTSNQTVTGNPAAVRDVSRSSASGSSAEPNPPRNPPEAVAIASKPADADKPGRRGRGAVQAGALQTEDAGAKPTQPVEIHNIYFESGSRDVIGDGELNVLRADAEILKALLRQRPGLTIRVEAHSDGGEILGETSPGRADYLISIDRAEFVRRKLIELGLPDAQLVTAGLGRTQPECEAATPECRKRNNRVHFEPGQ